MAKINHNNSLDTIDELFTDAKNKGIMHLVAEKPESAERKLPLNNKELLNFGTCGYLSLELDQRLKDGAIDYTQKYGTQYGISRGFLSSGINDELENYLSKMYNNKPVIVYSSTSSAHISVIPTLVSGSDAIILDQQAHMSIQTASQLLRQKGVPIEMIRHSNLEMLERMIHQLSQKHNKIWYMIDGVYSMYGDVAPMDELMSMLNKYECLHLYIDDAHGMSWHGINGGGYINSKINNHPRIMLMTTMGKGFGVTGGIAVFSDKESYRRVRVFGGPLVYSHPLAPPIIGAAIASAKIHLSEDIYRIQNELKENISYCNELLSQTDLTVMSNSVTPIKFIGMGHSKVAGNMVKRMLNDGFFVSPALFPAVSMKNSGIRVSISRHVNKEEIKQMVDALSFHFPKVLADENKSINDVRKAFKIKSDAMQLIKDTTENNLFTIEIERSIEKINKDEWDQHLGKNGSFDWDGLHSIEDVFKNNIKPEENWDFYYFIIRDKNKNPIIATFFSEGILKDDMLALESISIQCEEKRKTDPYYLTSKTLMMGSMLSEGEHIYINRTHKDWKQALSLLLEKVHELQEKVGANNLLLRDFNKEDIELNQFFIDEGFAPIDMPNSNIIENMKWNSIETLLTSLSSKNRKNFKIEILRTIDFYTVDYKRNLNNEEAFYFHSLYKNVNNKNKAFNMFEYPPNILDKLSSHKNWEFIILNLKPEHDTRTEKKALAVVWNYVTPTHMCPMIIGIDYKFNEQYKVYKQALYQVLKRARMLGLEKVYLGLSADTEKRKYGAKQIAKVAYLQTKDNYNMEVIESMSALPKEINIIS